jgi:hypothetical protein
MVFGIENRALTSRLELKYLGEFETNQNYIKVGTG